MDQDFDRDIDDQSVLDIDESLDAAGTGQPDSPSEIDGQWQWRRKSKVNHYVSHRHVEKRRRDRINRTLLKLKELVPLAKQKFKDRAGGRLEKAELLEMTIEHIQQLQAQTKLEEGFPYEMQYVHGFQAKETHAPSDTLYLQGFKDGVTHVLSTMQTLGMFIEKVPTRNVEEMFIGSRDFCRPKAEVNAERQGRVPSTLDALADAAVQRRAVNKKEDGDVASNKAISGHSNRMTSKTRLRGHFSNENSMCSRELTPDGTNLGRRRLSHKMQSVTGVRCSDHYVNTVSNATSVAPTLVAMVTPIPSQSNGISGEGWTFESQTAASSTPREDQSIEYNQHNADNKVKIVHSTTAVSGIGIDSINAPLSETPHQLIVKDTSLLQQHKHNLLPVVSVGTYPPIIYVPSNCGTN